MASSFWTFSRHALVPRLFRDDSPSLGRGQAGAHRTQLPDELLTSKSWFILLICATTAHFHGVDVDFAEAITILVTGILTSTMMNSLVTEAPFHQSAIDRILVGVDQAAEGDAAQDQRLDRRLPNIGQQMQDYGAAALNHAEDRGLLLLQGASARHAFQAAPTAWSTFFATAAGWPLWPAVT